MPKWETIYPRQIREGVHRIRIQGTDQPGPLVTAVHNREGSWVTPDVTVETINGGRRTFSRHIPVQVVEWDPETDPYV